MKHAHRDSDKELYFDKTFNADLMFLASIDLKRIEKFRPEKGGYTVTVSDAVMACFVGYIASKIDNKKSLCYLESFVSCDEVERYRNAVEHIKQWLIHCTEFQKNSGTF